MIALLCALLLLQAWEAPARAARKKNPLAGEAAVQAGRRLYVQHCLSCHGEKGKGDGKQAKDLEKPPGDLSNPRVWEQSDGALFWKITEGRKPMPSFEPLMGEEERWQVVLYTRSLAPRPRQPQGGAP